MFATILQRWGSTEVDPTGILLFFLAAVMWHSDWLKEMAATHPRHPFSMIPILLTPELLCDLKELVTLEPKGNVKCVTGIPPHIQNASVAKKILSLCEATLNTVKGMIETVKMSVKDVYEEKPAENGQVMGEQLKQMLDEHQASMVQLIDDKLTELKNEMRDFFQQRQYISKMAAVMTVQCHLPREKPRMCQSVIWIHNKRFEWRIKTTHMMESFGMCQGTFHFQQQCNLTQVGRCGFVDCRAMRQSTTVAIASKPQSDHFGNSNSICCQMKLKRISISTGNQSFPWWKQHQALKSERLASILTTSALPLMLQKSIWRHVWVMCLKMSTCIQNNGVSQHGQRKYSILWSSRMAQNKTKQICLQNQITTSRIKSTDVQNHRQTGGRCDSIWSIQADMQDIKTMVTGRASWLMRFFDASSHCSPPANWSRGCHRRSTGTTTTAERG